MLIYVSGGSGSGKSAFAESLVVHSGLDRRAYIATMEPWGREARERIARHRALRAGKGFATWECPRNLAALELPEGCAALLEDLTNLFANEWFGVGRTGAAERVLDGLSRLADTAACAVVVGNDLFSDGMDYDAETLEYLRALAAVNSAVAARADQVWEVVCGIPVCHKKDPGGREGEAT